MKGIVFTEFIEMVEDKFGLEVADGLLANPDLPSGGVYTAIGTYDHAEIVTMVMDLHRRVDVPISQLLRVYGEHLFGRFSSLYPNFFEGVNDTFTFLESIENHIHIEVRKLYPDAELPKFSTERENDSTLIMYYSSERAMGDFAYGLIVGCGKHFSDQLNIEMDPTNNQGTEVKFTITR